MRCSTGPEHGEANRRARHHGARDWAKEVSP
jgi:hypothetical protein